MADLARGIDVSNYAGDFDWAATSGLSFGICRASQGLGAPGANSPDPFLSWNVEVLEFWQSGSTSSYDNDVFNGSAAQLNSWITSYQPEAGVQSGQLKQQDDGDVGVGYEVSLPLR